MQKSNKTLLYTKLVEML